MTVSVVIATLGRPDRLRAALAALAALEPRPDEVVVVDGSADGSAEAVSSAAELPVRYVRSAPGLTRQRNRGLDAVTSDVVVFLDDDATLRGNAIARIAGAFADPGTVGFTGPVDEPSSHAIGGQRSRLRRLLHRRDREGTFTSYGYPRRIVDATRAFDVEFMPGCFMAARTRMAHTLRFDENLPGYGLAEDEDFSFRLSRLGRIRFDPSAVVTHANEGFSGRDRRQFGRTVVVHRHYLFRKNFDPRPRAVARFWLLVMLLVAHRLVNRDARGALGILQGTVDVARGVSPAELAR